MKTREVNNRPVITPAMEKAVATAFETLEKEGDVLIKLPQKEHLTTEFRDYACCAHNWQPWPEGVPVIAEDEFDLAQWCKTCGTTCLRESGEIFAIDATARFFGKHRGPKPESRPERKR
jgi:hypothetical protein